MAEISPIATTPCSVTMEVISTGPGLTARMSLTATGAAADSTLQFGLTFISERINEIGMIIPVTSTEKIVSITSKTLSD